MEFQIKTIIDRKAMTSMAKAARKTMRQKKSILIRTFGGIAGVMAMISGIIRSGFGDKNGWIDLFLAACLLAFILLGAQQGQTYQKSGFLKGSAEEFRSFISERTGKPVQYIR